MRRKQGRREEEKRIRDKLSILMVILLTLFVIQESTADGSSTSATLKRSNDRGKPPTSTPLPAIARDPSVNTPDANIITSEKVVMPTFTSGSSADNVESPTLLTVESPLINAVTTQRATEQHTTSQRSHRTTKSQITQATTSRPSITSKFVTPIEKSQTNMVDWQMKNKKFDGNLDQIASLPGPESAILFSLKYSGLLQTDINGYGDVVKRVAVDPNSDTDLIRCDFDPVYDNIYFIEDRDTGLWYLQMLHISGTGQFTIDILDYKFKGLAVDWLERKLFVGGYEIRKYNTETFESESPLSITGTVNYLSLDIFHSEIYWCSYTDPIASIYRSSFDGSIMVSILERPSTKLYTMVVDYIHANMYVYDKKNRSIESMTLDGVYKEVLVGNLGWCDAISINGDFIIWNDNGKIMKANKETKETTMVFESQERIYDLTTWNVRSSNGTEYEHLGCPKVARCWGINGGWTCLQRDMICDTTPDCYGELDEFYCCNSDTLNCSSIQELKFLCRISKDRNDDQLSLDFVDLKSSPFWNIFKESFLSFHCSLEIKYIDDSSSSRKVNISDIQNYHIFRQFIGPTIFRNFNEANKVSFSGQIPSIMPNGLKPFHQLHALVLEKTNIVNIGKDFPSEIQNELGMHTNLNPAFIYNGTFKGLDNLDYLKISKNSFLSTIEENAFKGLQNLQILEISENSKLSQIKPDAFNGLEKLRVLVVLGNSPTQSNSEYILKDLSLLENVTLSREDLNKITVIGNIPSLKKGDFYTDTLNILLILKSNIKKITHFFFDGIEKLEKLTISENNFLSRIHKNAFSGHKNLLQLTISNNVRLTKIEVGAFDGLELVTDLTISQQYSITSIEAGLLDKLTNLKVIDLRQNNLRVTTNIFEMNEKINSIYSDIYSFCCMKPCTILRGNCHAPKDDVSSCNDLIADRSLRTCLWQIGLIAYLGNMAVIFHRFINDRKSFKQTFAIFVVNLSISDAVMGMYMLTIAFHDSLYEGSYVWHEFDWKESSLCKVAGTLAFVSNESSVIFISLITIDRFLAVKYPLGGKRFSLLHAYLLSTAAWIVSVLLAIIPTLIYPEFYSYSGTCIALPLTGNFKPGWQWTIAIFLGLNFILFIFITIGQISILKKIKQSAKRVGNTNNRKEREAAVLLIMVAFTDGLCWLPVGIMVMMALAGIKIPREVYAWIIVFVLPVNSAINPFLYTFVPLCRKKQKELKYAKAKSDPTPPNRNQKDETGGNT